ncbi:polymeric immunoglobulin receptor-like isoform X3 [Paramormyrops kingsleyae]|uniref:polymeric immunoglobulin receptor-like isoform X3 n=1 Tax=Paramormyrops kingsleyae TaxID=1676925 RepID=UPI003B96ED49
MYQHQEKYWCRGSDWSSCTPIVRTNSPKKSAEVSIRDDPGQRLFTVIMNNLKIVDSGYYWCGVEISRGSAVGTRVSLSVTEGVSTLNTVTVERGGSVTIPCFYDNEYRQQVKYWCKGSDWSSCTPIVHTESPNKSGEVLIRNDPGQRLFTVIMNNLKIVDSGYYWCGVEISRGSAVGTRVSLSVTEGVSTLNTVTVERGGSVTIPCFYENEYRQQVKYWCKGSDWSSCTPIVRTDSPKKSGEVSIRDDPVKRVFNVTMNNLTTGNSGYYWCGVEISRDSAVGTQVYLSVSEGVFTLNTVTVERGGSVTIPCFYDNKYRQYVKYWCKGSDLSSCTPIIRTDSPKMKDEVSITNDPVKRVFNVTMNNLTAVDSGYYWCGVEINRSSAVGTRVYLSVTGWIIEKQSLFLYVGLGLSVLLLIIIIITWKVCDKHKKKRAMNQNPGSTELTLNPDHEFAVIDRTGIIKGNPLEQQVSSRCSSHHSVVSSSKSVVYSSFTLKHIEGPP